MGIWNKFESAASWINDLKGDVSQGVEDNKAKLHAWAANRNGNLDEFLKRRYKAVYALDNKINATELSAFVFRQTDGTPTFNILVAPKGEIAKGTEFTVSFHTANELYLKFIRERDGT